MSGIIVLILRALMAVSLYVFLGLAFYTLWRDLRTQSRVLTNRQVPVLSIQFDETSEGRAHTFSIAEVIIGRDPACELPLDDESVSARHARLSFHHKQWWLEDLHSTNGTFLNDDPVQTAMVIMTGDSIRCGQTAFSIKIDQK
ncbi:MAG TPA: FHA domain-containing protein [Longilinea sp.]|nr:FHA domain-containing protein [Longilinea sp.]